MSVSVYWPGNVRDNELVGTVVYWSQSGESLSENLENDRFYFLLQNDLNTYVARHGYFSIEGMIRVRKPNGWARAMRIRGTDNNQAKYVDIHWLEPRELDSIMSALPPNQRFNIPADAQFSLLARNHNNVPVLGSMKFVSWANLENYINERLPRFTAGSKMDLNTLIDWQLQKIKYIASRL